MKKDKVARLQQEIAQNAHLVETAEARVLAAEADAKEKRAEAEEAKLQALEATERLRIEKFSYQKGLNEERATRHRLERELAELRETHERELEALSSTHSRQLTRAERDAIRRAEAAEKALKDRIQEAEGREATLEAQLAQAEQQGMRLVEEARREAKLQEEKLQGTIVTLGAQCKDEAARANRAEEDAAAKQARIDELVGEIDRLKAAAKPKGPRWSNPGNKTGLFSQPGFLSAGGAGGAPAAGVPPDAAWELPERARGAGP